MRRTSRSPSLLVQPGCCGSRAGAERASGSRSPPLSGVGAGSGGCPGPVLDVTAVLRYGPFLMMIAVTSRAADMSTQNQVLDLLKDLRDELAPSYAFIAHDPAVMRHIAQRTAVMHLGRIVEIGPTERVYNQPEHPHTKALLSAIPQPDHKLARRNDRVLLRADPPDPSAPPTGCPFHTRCGFAMDQCVSDVPLITSVEGGGTVACYVHTPSRGDSLLSYAPGGPT